MKRLVLIAFALMVAAPAVGQVEFTFEGFAKFNPAPDSNGALMTAYGIANPPVSVPTPIPMDFDNFQYTVCVSDMVVTAFAHDMGLGTKDYAFANGGISIFEDPIGGGTPGDFAVPATFTDGVMLLLANVDTPWDLHMDDPFGFGTYSGAGIGTCDMVGGAALPLLVSMDYELNDWVFAGTGVSEPWFPFITVPDGYHYVFGVKIIFPYDPTADEDVTWGEVKTLFR
ncbi:hypothetical protein H8E07_20555 [bacterium]|nr:hypothetical protein [bacterium]